MRNVKMQTIPGCSHDNTPEPKKDKDTRPKAVKQKNTNRRVKHRTNKTITETEPEI